MCFLVSINMNKLQKYIQRLIILEMEQFRKIVQQLTSLAPISFLFFLIKIFEHLFCQNKTDSASDNHNFIWFHIKSILWSFIQMTVIVISSNSFPVARTREDSFLDKTRQSALCRLWCMARSVPWWHYTAKLFSIISSTFFPSRLTAICNICTGGE